MKPIDAIKKCLVNYFNGKGRASKAEFWWFFAFYIACVYGPLFLFPDSAAAGGFITISVLGLVFPLWMAGIRRLHDVGMNGLFILIPFLNLIFLATSGEAQANKYGDPVQE